MRNDRRQTAAAESFVSKGAWEFSWKRTWVLTAVYDLTQVEIVTAVEMLLHHRDLTLQDPDSVAAALEQYRILILETGRKAGHIPLGTLDRNLSRLDGAEGL